VPYVPAFRAEVVIESGAFTVTEKVVNTLGFTLVETVMVAVQGPLDGGVYVTEFPLTFVPLVLPESDSVPQLLVCCPRMIADAFAETFCRTGRDVVACWAPLDEPLMLQFRAAEPLKSLAMVAERGRAASPAAVVGAVLSPLGKLMATAWTVNVEVAVLEPLATEVAAMLALQLALSDDSEGGV
jgi:hypothetical protein